MSNPYWPYLTDEQFKKLTTSIMPLDNMKLNASGNWEPPSWGGYDWEISKPDKPDDTNPCAAGCDWKIYDSGFTRFEYCARCNKERSI